MLNRRFLLRELVYSRSQGLVFILCVALALCSVMAINSLRRDVQQSIANDARELHGGDVIIRSHLKFSQALQQEIAAVLQDKNGKLVRTWEFYSVARRVDGQNSLLSNIKAVEHGYPLYGEVVLGSGKELRQVLQAGMVVVSPDLLERLDLVTGDRLLLGDSSFKIIDTLERESVRPVELFNFGPRILVLADDLEQMNLVQQGSRVHYQNLLKFVDQGDIDGIVARLKKKVSAEQERVDSYMSAGSRVKRFFDNLLFFLGLISIFTLLLAGIGMQSSLTALLRSREKSVAVLRSLGATGPFLLSHYLLLVFILSGVGCLLATVLAMMLTKSFHQLFAGLLPDGIVLGVGLIDIFETLGVGAVVVFVFTFIPLSKLKDIKPAAVFRKEFSMGRRTTGHYLVSALGAAMFAGLILVQLNDVRIGLYFLSGLLMLTLLILGLTWFVLQLLARFKTSSLSLRQAIRSMQRPGNATSTIAVTLGSALSLLLSIYLVKANLYGTYIANYPPDAPNLFCLDIQKGQAEDFRELVGGRVELFPVVRARLLDINGKKIDREAEVARRGDSLAREFNLTYRRQLLADEILMSGDSLFAAGSEGGSLVSVSVLDTVAEMGDMQLGDVLRFNIQGVPLQATISSIRSRTKSMLYPFFYFVFPEKYLSAAPLTFFAALQVEKDGIGGLQNRIVNSFPNISTINVTEAAAELGRVMQKLSGIVNFFASFSILAGLLILVSSVLATRIARTKEAVYYKVLGADSRFVLRLFFLENMLLALISGCAAILVAQFGSWALCRFLFDIAYQPNWLVTLAILGGTVSLVVAAGLLSCLSVLKEKPMGFLRELRS